MPGDQIIDMTGVGDGFVTASRTMDMAWFVRAAGMLWGADVGIAIALLDGVLIDVVAVHAVEVPVVQIIHMVAVPHRLMTAAGSVDMGVRFVNGVFVVHRPDTLSLPDSRRRRKRRAEERMERASAHRQSSVRTTP